MITSTQPDLQELVELPAPIELAATLWPLAHGTRDPTIRFAADGIWRAVRLPDGAATLQLRQLGPATLRARAWGPGAGSAMSMITELVGGLDEPGALVPQHRVLRDTIRHHPGLRLPRTRRLLDALIPAILEQKVTGVEPSASTIAELPYFRFHTMGVERRRADLLRFVARQAARVESAPSPDAADRVLRAIPGIGPWTAAEVLRVAWGAPDAVSIGDFHIPNLVAWALAGEARADDARMLELLEPYKGQRGRVQRLLEASGVRIPRFGPRMSPRSIAAI